MKNWYLKLPNNIRAGINTAWQSAVGTFAVLAFGFLGSVQEWAGNTSQEFPSVEPLGKAVGAALVGLVVGVLTAVFRGLVPGPVYPTTTTQVIPAADGSDGGAEVVDGGWASWQIIVGVLIAIVCLIFIFQNVNVDESLGALLR